MARQKKIEKQPSELAFARGVLDLVVGFVTAVEEAGGTIEDARRAIFKDKLLKKRIGLLVMGKLKLEGFPCQKNVPHLIPDWVKEVVEDVEPTQFDPKKLRFPSFLRDGDNGRTDGQTMRQRAKKMKANFGLSDVPTLLGKDGKGLETIPVELRGKVYIILTGTGLRSSDGFLCVPYLLWNGGAWVLSFGWPGFGWYEDGRLVSCEEALDALGSWNWFSGPWILGACASPQKTPHVKCFRANDVRGSSFLWYNNFWKVNASVHGYGFGRLKSGHSNK